MATWSKVPVSRAFCRAALQLALKGAALRAVLLDSSFKPGTLGYVDGRSLRPEDDDIYVCIYI